MNKEIHFYEYSEDKTTCHSWNETKYQINNSKKEIHTTQMGLLRTDLVEMGYRIFVHESKTKFYEIVVGGKNERTNKAIRPAHNLFKMWQAGAFCENSMRE